RSAISKLAVAEIRVASETDQQPCVIETSSAVTRTPSPCRDQLQSPVASKTDQQPCVIETSSAVTRTPSPCRDQLRRDRGLRQTSCQQNQSWLTKLP
ncbi:hypothetical protein pipiens_020184, partial [Culex pipiens pipiens]